MGERGRWFLSRGHAKPWRGASGQHHQRERGKESAGFSAVGMQSPGVRLRASIINEGWVRGGAGVSAVDMQSLGVGLRDSTIRGAGARGSVVVSAVGMQSPGVGLPASTIS
eukprot:jgi/Undpi1/9250/HiC_scaffold_26.g11708.m1